MSAQWDAVFHALTFPSILKELAQEIADKLESGDQVYLQRTLNRYAVHTRK